jgi:hypothetical protein
VIFAIIEEYALLIIYVNATNVFLAILASFALQAASAKTAFVVTGYAPTVPTVLTEIAFVKEIGLVLLAVNVI